MLRSGSVPDDGHTDCNSHVPKHAHERQDIMFIARWQFTAQFGKMEECINVIRKWEIDVGQRIGWRPGSTRLLTGFIGGAESSVEFDVHFDNLSDLENAWNDRERNPHHREYMKMLEHLIIGGTNRWSIYREATMAPAQ